MPLMRNLILRVWDSPTLATWASFAVRSLSLAIVLPLGLRQLSSHEALVWQVMATIASIQLLLDLGLSSTFTRLFAYAFAGATTFDRQPLGDHGRMNLEPNWRGCEAIWTIQVRTYKILTLAALFIMLTLGTWSIAAPINSLPKPWVGWLAWGITLITIPAIFQTFSYGSWLLGMNAVSRLRRAEAAFALGGTLTSIAVLASGGKLLGLVAGYNLWIWFGFFRNRHLARRVQGGRLTSFNRGDFDRRIWDSIWPIAWRAGIGSLLGGGLVQGTGIIATSLAGPRNEGLATGFLILLRVVTTVSQFSQAPFFSKLPALAGMRASGNRDALLKTARLGMLYSHWVFVAGSVGGAVFLPWMLKILGKNAPTFDPLIWWTLCLALFIERFGAMNLQLYSTSNHIVWHKANGGAAILIIIAGALLIPNVGLVGLPLAILSGNCLFYAPYASLLVYGDLKLNPLHWEVGLAVPPVCCIIVVMMIDLYFKR